VSSSSNAPGLRQFGVMSNLCILGPVNHLEQGLDVVSRPAGYIQHVSVGTYWFCAVAACCCTQNAR